MQPGGEQTAEGGRNHGSPAFLMGVAGALGLLVVLTLLLASRESFSRDDFGFLLHVQSPTWSWLDTYLPLDKRGWWAYRPLGTDTYFYSCFKLFGWNPMGFFSVSLGLHFLTGLIVYRLAIQLGFEPRIAIVTAFLAVSRHPTLWGIYYASVFHYVGAVFFSLLATSLFLDYARRGGGRLQVASCLALTLALLCNEFPVTLPVFFVFLSVWASNTDPDGRLKSDGLIPSAAVFVRAASRALPQLAIAGLYLVVRLGVIAPAALPTHYDVSFAPRYLLQHLRVQIFYVFGDQPTLLAACLLILAIATLAMASVEGRRLLRWLTPLNAICVLWIVAVLTPFLILTLSHSRFSTPAEAPLCLLLGSYLSVFWSLYGHRHRRALEVALVLLVFAALPYRTLWERSHELYGVHAANLLKAVHETYPDIELRTKVVLLYNAPGLASYAGGSLFRRNAYGGNSALQAYWPRKRLTMDLHNLWEEPVSGDCASCVYLQLLPNLEVAPAEKRFLEFRSPYY